MSTKPGLAIKRARALIAKFKSSGHVEDLHQASDWLRWGCGPETAQGFIDFCKIEILGTTAPQPDYLAIEALFTLYGFREENR